MQFVRVVVGWPAADTASRVEAGPAFSAPPAVGIIPITTNVVSAITMDIQVKLFFVTSRPPAALRTKCAATNLTERKLYSFPSGP